MHSTISVDSYLTPLDAELAKAFLESHEIPVQFEGEALVGSAYALGPMLGGIRLLVGEQHEARARALLEDYHRALKRSGRMVTSNVTEASDGDDSDSLPENGPDNQAALALATTIVGFLLLPVVIHLYAIALLLRIAPTELSTRARRQYAIAWALNFVVVVVASWTVARALG